MRILVIEDEEEIADFLVRGLREEGFTVERVADGRAGGWAARSETWDLILLDWWLPGIDGLEVLKQLRAVDVRTPVLFLTARDAIADRVTGLDHGADDYLCKPFAFAELLARVRALTRRTDERRGTTLTYADITVDLATHRCERNGRPLQLKAKEYALLVFFLRHAEQVLSRTRIYESVWGDNFDGLSNTLEVHVMELRRKLDAHGPRLIQTLRGRGYQLLSTAASDFTP